MIEIDNDEHPFNNDEIALHHALHAAQEAFNEYLEEEAGIDPVYFSAILRGRLYYDTDYQFVKREVTVKPESELTKNSGESAGRD